MASTWSKGKMASTEVSKEGRSLEYPSTESREQLAERPHENSGVSGSNPLPPTSFPYDARFTPKWLAQDMVALAFIREHDMVLEPSAGEGAIVDAIHAFSRGRVHAVELNERMVRTLRDTNATVHHANFLEWEPPHGFDRVVMNPPKNGALHVRRAAQFLRPYGGRLVALLHADQATEVQRTMKDVRIYPLPLNLFQIEGRPIDSALIVWDKT